MISHNLHDVFEVAHRITVLRLGRNVGVYERTRRRSRRSSRAITAGIPTKVAGIADDSARWRYERSRVDEEVESQA